MRLGAGRRDCVYFPEANELSGPALFVGQVLYLAGLAGGCALGVASSKTQAAPTTTERDPKAVQLP